MGDSKHSKQMGDTRIGVYRKMEIVNIRNKCGKHTIYIGRKCTSGKWNLPESKWCNPFKICNSASRTQVINMYREYLLRSKELYSSLYELLGQTLACWCKPEECHGDILCYYTTEFQYNFKINSLSYSGSLSYLSGVRTAELYLSFLGVTNPAVEITGSCPFPRITNSSHQYRDIPESCIIVEAINRPLDIPSSYLVATINVKECKTVILEVMANNLIEFKSGFRLLVPTSMWIYNYSSRICNNYTRMPDTVTLFD